MSLKPAAGAKRVARRQNRFTPPAGSAPQASVDILRKGKWNLMKAPATESRETAETLAIQALAFIAEEPERLGAFLAASGIGPDAIRDAAREPGFLGGVLDHMLGNESLLVAFAGSAGLNPTSIARARRILGGKQWEREFP
jgi:hypothetical protein